MTSLLQINSVFFTTMNIRKSHEQHAVFTLDRKCTEAYGWARVNYGWNIKLFLVHVCGLISLYEINTDVCTNVLLNHHVINIICHSNMFQLLKGHLQGV
jgi:hypothetical protein